MVRAKQPKTESEFWVTLANKIDDKAADAHENFAKNIA